MATQQKIDSIAELKERLQGHQLAVLTKYIGINAGQVSTLRKQLRDKQVEYKVYKNTLAKRALDELELSGAAKFMDGPTAWAFSNDPVAPSKILKDFAKDAPQVEMLGGILDGKVITKSQLEALASLPPREVLLAQIIGTIQAPIRNAVSAINAVPNGLVNVLDQIRKKKEEAAAA
ncbi:MAG: 50S ribosomal protein L10 [Candidatus Hydrogenedentes bacterium]|nr:50S ribosomal protein L10 [Candidatus Hydrogenedentota bacterium]